MHTFKNEGHEIKFSPNTLNVIFLNEKKVRENRRSSFTREF